jgi:GH24 family phage-related lysozyme (muramidase)
MKTTWIKRILASGTLLGASVVGVVEVNEGYSSTTYYDGAGVATICYGETKGVKMGMVKTRSECDKQLQESLSAHAKVFDNIPLSTPDVVALGTIDMAYNVGVSGFNSSSVKKAIINGDYSQAGQNVLKWKYITVKGKKYDCSVKGNKVCYGLWKRRLWQSKATGNQFKTPQEALHELKLIYQ